MKLENWIDKQNGIDDVLAEDINSIAHAIQENIKNIDNLSKGKADKATTYTKTETDQALSGKADKADSLAGYGILDTFTRVEISDMLNWFNDNKADNNKILDYITYSISDNEVTITGCNKSISGAHIIPDTIKGYPVTKIGQAAFYGCNKLKSIIIPESITFLGDSAFEECTSLESVKVPNNVTTLSATFGLCSSLRKVKISNNIISINQAFAFCYNLHIYYDGTKEEWDKIEKIEYSSELTDAAIHYNYGFVPTPREDTDAANKEYVDRLKHQKVSITDGDTITLADNTTYYAEGEISNLTVAYPDTDFICSLEFTLASDGDITITLPESKYIGGAPAFANGETWELNIKNGVVVGGLVE